MPLAASTQRGVTLIELLIAVAILGVLMAIGAPSFSSWLQNSQIKNAAGSIQDGLQQARAEAVRRNTRVQFELSGGSGWTVGCTSSGATCPSVIEDRSSNEGSPNAVVTADEDTIVFNGLGRVVPTPADDIDIDVTNPAGGTCIASSGTMRCLRIAVSTGGQIRMCDPALPNTSPKGC